MAFNYFKNRALNLTESDIRFAMAHTKSNRAAARFIGCNLVTYIKYAKRYVDSATQKTLYDLHKNQGHKGAKNAITPGKYIDKVSMIEVIEGKHPEFPADQLKKKLIREGLMVEECNYCGFNERRITDGSVPLVLIWKDGDFKNHLESNLELACYNHYFLMYDDVFEKAETIDRKCKGYYND